MKGFFKFTFACIIGVLIGLFIFIFIVIGIIGGASKEKPVVVEPGTVLVVKLANPVMDRQPESPFEFFNPVSFAPDGRMGLDMILKNIEKAKKDENICGIVLDLSVIPQGMATLHEIREALLDFKSSGKFIYSYSDIYSQGTYYLASVADKIYIAPNGQLMFLGLSSEVLFFKGALDKLGVEMQVLKYGEYKGATEPLVFEKLSKENRQQIQDYLNSLWSHIVEGIAESRDINVDVLNKLADEMKITGAPSAVENGLADSMIYYDEFIDMIKELTDTKKSDDIKSIGMKKYSKVPEVRTTKGLERNKIAVVYAEGEIVSGTGDGMIGGDRYARTIREARRDSSIKAIVLRINSGGGDGLASDIIWREVKLAAETKPLIVSMGDVAASGGYYIAAPATKILANPNTLTGSIGVFGVWPNIKKLANDKLGISTDIVKTNDHADFGFIMEPLEEQERKVLQNEVDNFYAGFLKVVAEGRAMTIEEVDKIARGHVYSGSDALKIGLIDDFGGLDKAVKLAAEEAEIETYRIVKLPEAEDAIQKLLSDLTGENARVKYLEEKLGENYVYYQELNNLGNIKGIQARIPYSLIVR